MKILYASLFIIAFSLLVEAKLYTRCKVTAEGFSNDWRFSPVHGCQVWWGGWKDIRGGGVVIYPEPNHGR